MMRRPHWPRRQLCCALLLKDRSLHDLDSLLLCTIQPSTFMLAMLVLLMCTHLFLASFLAECFCRWPWTCFLWSFCFSWRRLRSLRNGFWLTGFCAATSISKPTMNVFAVWRYMLRAFLNTKWILRRACWSPLRSFFAWW